MCYICLKDNPFEMIDWVTGQMEADAREKARVKAHFLKKVIGTIETTDEDRCYIGDITLERLKEEQYAVAREFLRLTRRGGRVA